MASKIINIIENKPVKLKPLQCGLNNRLAEE